MRFRRTTLITVGCVAVLAGLGLSRKVNLQPAVWLLVFTPLLLIFRRKNIAALSLIILLGLSLGLWRGGVYMDKVGELVQLTGQKVTIEASATSDSVYGRGSQLEFTASKITVIEPHAQPLTGKFRISGFGEPMVYRGDRVQITGKLYPTRGSYQARISYGQLKRVGAETSWINNFTRRFAAGTGMLIPTVAGWFAWPANLLLTYILDVARLLSTIRGIFLHRSVSLIGMLGLYATILLAMLLALRRRTPKADIISGVKPQET